ncbi:MAG: DUF4402 domain-containing protein [Bacteroidetes bacterium]|nr:MAG: DUF4402 domain-containing protein [Bacteroidota bacterium]
MKLYFFFCLNLFLLCSVQFLLSQNKAELKIKIFATISEDTLITEVKDSVIYRKSLTADNVDINYIQGGGVGKVLEAKKEVFHTIQPKIVAPLILQGSGYYDTTFKHLNYGSIKASNLPGCVSINQNGIENWGGVIFDGGNDIKEKILDRLYRVPTGAAQINLKGEMDMSYKIYLPDSVIIKNVSDKNTWMIVRYLTTSTRNHRLDSSGEQELNLGGILFIYAKQKPGMYQGEFIVKIVYNEPVIKYVK